MGEDKKPESAGKTELVLQNVLSSMPVAVAWANPATGVIEYVNRKFTSMFGYELEDLSTVHDWITDCYADPEQAQKIDGFWQAGLKSSVPEDVELDDVELDIRCKDGSTKTVLSGKILLPHRAGALATFLDITPRKEKETLIQKQALEDPLTGLLNRRAFSEKLQLSLQACRESGGSMALMLIDLDGFKPVNDSHGHDQGDELLIEVAGRLRETVRDHDLLCRIGGDEFGVILDSLVSEKKAVSIAERILHGLARQPYMLNGQAIRLSASIGIAIYPGDAECETSLFKQADIALYRAKEDGRGRWCRAA